MKMKQISGRVVMVFGTFDLLHKGHFFFLKEAKKKGDYLVVSIARDKNVLRIKGVKPMFSERQRLKDVKNTKLADEVVLGDIKGYLRHIKKISPDIIALGYDQKAYTDTLKDDLIRAGISAKVIRIKGYRTTEFKSSKIKERLLTL